MRVDALVTIAIHPLTNMSDRDLARFCVHGRLNGATFYMHQFFCLGTVAKPLVVSASALAGRDVSPNSYGLRCPNGQHP